MTLKTSGWESRLTAYVRGVSATGFRPGALDCGLFFGGGVNAMTGKDFTGPFRGKYKTIEGGKKIAERLGFADHVEYAASILPELPTPLLATRGDGAVIPVEGDNLALGIVQGEKVYVMNLNGVVLVPLTQAVRAFRV